MNPGTLERAVFEAEKWIGTVEQPPGSNKVPGVTDWYGLVGPWCAMWVSRVFWDAGLPLPASTSKGFAYTPSGAAWFKKQGRWHTSNPRRGDVVFFDFPGDNVNRISHVGIVTGVRPDGSIETVEGNTDERGGRTGGKVMRRVRRVGIVGYGRPAYATPSPAQPMHYYPEDNMIRIPLTVDFHEGRGYVDVFGFHRDRVVTANVLGPDPAVSGWDETNVPAFEKATHGETARLVFETNRPVTAKGVLVEAWVAA